MGASLYWPMLMTWLARKRIGVGLSRRMSLYNVCWSAGATISPFLGAWLSQIEPALPLYFSAGMWIVAAAILLGAMLFLPRIRADRSFKTGGRKTSSPRDPATRLRYAAWLGAFLTFAAIGVVARMFPLWGTEVLGLEKTTVGWLLLVRTLFLSLGFAAMGAAVFWHYNSRFLVGILLVLGAALIAIVFARAIPALLPVMFVLGLLQAAAYFASMFHSTAGAERRAAALAVHETMLNLGLLTGGIVGGLLYQVLTFEHGCVLFAALVLIGAAVQTWVCHWADGLEGRGTRAQDGF